MPQLSVFYPEREVQRCRLFNAILGVDVAAIVLEDVFHDFEVAVGRAVDVER